MTPLVGNQCLYENFQTIFRNQRTTCKIELKVKSAYTDIEICVTIKFDDYMNS